MEKHELSKIEFEIIDDALKALLRSRPRASTAHFLSEPAPFSAGHREGRHHNTGRNRQSFEAR
jgi:hypothetical protein